MTKETIKSMIDLVRTSDNPNVRRDIMRTFCDFHVEEVPIKWLRDAFTDDNIENRRTAIDMIADKRSNDVSLDLLDLARKDKDCYVRMMTYEVFANRDDIPMGWLLEGLSDPDSCVRAAAVELFANMDDIPIEISKMALNENESSTVRRAACRVLLSHYFDNTKEENEDEGI